MDLPAGFTERMKTVLGEEFDAFIAQYDLPPVRGLRVNTLRLSKERFLELSPWKVGRSETLDEGLVLLEEAEHIGTHPYHIAGLFYMQEPSAMSVIAEAGIEPGMKVLDLCAAPGGKSGGAAARLRGKGLLVSNEIVPSRAKQLARNLERLGVTNAVVTSAHPDAVANALPGYFDRVIVDAPCSGEGMFRKDPQAIAEWSLEHVASCAVRQRAIMESAARCVAPGGKLIYSTCTFSQEENEGVIEGFLSDHPDFSPEMTRRLYPHTCTGEGHFAARLVRSGSLDRSAAVGRKDERNAAKKSSALRLPDKSLERPVREFLSASVENASALPLCVYGQKLVYCPFEYPDELASLPIVSFGVEVGEFTKGRLRPSHAFFMAAHGLGYRKCFDFAPDDPLLLSFLGGNTLPVSESDAEEFSGCFCPVTVSGFAVGFGKVSDGQLKNHLPRGLTVGSYR
ncbi:MAG: hypothetical protein IKO51_06800 [Clostridia bacterium]|nr:hypothetical protein [Clostridia bacterium]